MLNSLLSTASVMKSIGGVLLAITILLVMVTVHEFGHYIAGKLLGFKINEFAVGFGPAIFKKRSKKTGELFALRVVPLGGYCAFDGEDEADEEPQEKAEEPFAEMQAEKAEKAEETEKQEETPQTEEYPEPKGERFNDQPPWKRIIVLIAGATMNYLLALFIIVMMFACIGRPVLQVEKFDYVLDKDGQKQYYNTEKGLETYQSGLQSGDIILEIDGKTMYLVSDYIDALRDKKSGDTVSLLIIRGGEKQSLDITIVDDANAKNMSDTNAIFFSLGIACKEEMPNENGEMKMTLTRGGQIRQVPTRDGFFQTLGNSFVYSFKIGGTVLRSLGELLTGKMSIKSMGGPITTISFASEAASMGIFPLLNFAALIGVNLAVFNLLPVPALDGSKVIFCIIEWIRKKPVNRKVEAIIHFVGIIFLFGFAILVDLIQIASKFI